ncbi:MAG: hypothetical protein R2779_05980 [Crocinitomicaceae bacterium]
MGGESVLFTFYPHPKMVLIQPDNHGIKITSNSKKRLVNLPQQSYQNIYHSTIPTDFSQLSAMEFVEKFLVNQLGVKHLVIGYDHHLEKAERAILSF